MAKKNKDRGNGGGLTAVGLLWRFIVALLLVFATYNPSGESGYHWIAQAIANKDFEPLHLILIAVLAIGWVIYWSHWVSRLPRCCSVASSGCYSISACSSRIRSMRSPGYRSFASRLYWPSACHGHTSGAGLPASTTSRTSTTSRRAIRPYPYPCLSSHRC